MKLHTTTCFFLVSILTGCGEQSSNSSATQTHDISQSGPVISLDANAENCAPDMKAAILSNLRDEADRNVFNAHCQSFDQRKLLTSGTFKKSPPGDY